MRALAVRTPMLAFLRNLNWAESLVFVAAVATLLGVRARNALHRR